MESHCHARTTASGGRYTVHTTKGSPTRDQQPNRVMCSGLKGLETGGLGLGVGNHIICLLIVHYLKLFLLVITACCQVKSACTVTLVRIHKGNEVSSCMKNLMQKHRTPLAISDWVLWQLPEKPRWIL